MSRTQTEKFEVLTKASVAEMLHEIAETLGRLNGCAYLSASQEEHLHEASGHIEMAVAEWIDDVTDDDALPSRRKRVTEPSLMPEHPERGLDCVLDMLAIYHDDLDERDFTSMQLQRITIAAHNLLAVVQEIRKSAH
jgi:hypothetical protein